MAPKMYDIAIIGAGIAGLSAAINASADGHKVVLLDRNKPGGQAGSATLIENVLGFPEGVTGQQLIADAYRQALKFKTTVIFPFDVEFIARVNAGGYGKAFDIHSYNWLVSARSVILAGGQSWRSYETCDVKRYEGKGVTYGSPDINKRYEGKTIAIVGAANSAGQAAMFLSQCPDCNVILIMRGDKVRGTMSRYLSDRILNCPNIKICTEAEVCDVHGLDKLESITYACKGQKVNQQVDELFILIGSEPSTEWLEKLDHLIETRDGFIETGSEVVHHGILARPYETTAPGVFAIGDIRLGSAKRVSAAIGEGASVIPHVSDYLRTIKTQIQTTSHVKETV